MHNLSIDTSIKELYEKYSEEGKMMEIYVSTM
jgi:hypothetical protein